MSEPKHTARVGLLICLAVWTRENLAALPADLQELILDPDYFPQPWQTFRFQTPEADVEVDAGSFLSAYRTLAPDSHPVRAQSA